jgi:hypothetical protein
MASGIGNAGTSAVGDRQNMAPTDVVGYGQL